jgi:hypothetical protein
MARNIGRFGVKEVVRIGAGSAFANDSALAVMQMLAGDPPDYLVFEHLAEGLMSPLAEAMQRSPDLGYSTNILDVHLGPHLAAIKAAGVKIVTNAGGLNPAGLARALQRLAAQQGLSFRIGVVEGDDLRGREAEFAAAGCADMFSGAAWPATIVSANAYLGAFPIAAALDADAEIVVTGRVVDSALTLGPLIHEFGWRPQDYDLLAAGTAAGHLLECGAQATGGTFTDWLHIPDWENIGYPIAECRADGSFVLTKPQGTGGVVSVGSVSEQLVYEIGDPSRYLVPDVTCDFTEARLEQVGLDRVRVSGVRGAAPSDDYKVCATYFDGWRMSVTLPVLGAEAATKARRMAEGVVRRAGRVVQARDLPPCREVQIDVIGAGALFPAGAPGGDEVVCRIVSLHDDQAAAAIYAHESRCAMTNASSGTMALGPAAVTPINRLFSFLLPKAKVPVTISVGDDPPKAWTASLAGGSAPALAPAFADPPLPDTPCNVHVPLADLAWARSGDKGGMFNVGVIARRPEYYPYICAALQTASVAQWFAHVFDDPSRPKVERFLLPGPQAVNFLFHDALAGGQTVGLRLDSNAKGMAQQLLRFEVPIPSALIADWTSPARYAPLEA